MEDEAELAVEAGAVADAGTVTESATGESHDFDWRELITVVLLSLTTILTAWSGFQSSKWGGAMSISFSQATGARIEASRLDAVDNRKQTIQVALFTQWLQFSTNKQSVEAVYVASQFPEPLKTAFVAWRAIDPTINPKAPSSPFEMPQYRIPEAAQAAASDKRADQKFALALKYNQRGDNYTLLAVAFASVLFFAAISGRMKDARSQWALLGVGLAIFFLARLLAAVVPAAGLGLRVRPAESGTGGPREHPDQHAEQGQVEQHLDADEGTWEVALGGDVAEPDRGEHGDGEVERGHVVERFGEVRR